MSLDALGMENTDRVVLAPTGGHTCRELSKTLDSVVADTPEIPFAGMRLGHIIIPTGSAITLLTFHVAESMGGTFIPLHDEGGTAITQTVAATKAYLLPPELHGATAVKIQSDNDGAVFLTLSE